MKLIIGLGNPGKEYEKTKHNIGFLYLNYFKNKNKFSDFKNENKFKGIISIGNLDGEKIILLQPQTFMNLSGESLKKIVNFYKIDLEDILVIYDDLSMEFGKLRFRERGSAGGHNGVKSIIQYFGDNFKRIKVGIGYNDNFEVSDRVLSRFNNEELNELETKIFPKINIILKEKI